MSQPPNLNVRCNCGFALPRKVTSSNNANNPNRPYYGCPNWGRAGDCRFFEWEDRLLAAASQQTPPPANNGVPPTPRRSPQNSQSDASSSTRVDPATPQRNGSQGITFGGTWSAYEANSPATRTASQFDSPRQPRGLEPPLPIIPTERAGLNDNNTAPVNPNSPESSQINPPGSPEIQGANGQSSEARIAVLQTLLKQKNQEIANLRAQVQTLESIILSDPNN